jgi:DNA-directed RNA polymerase subunit N (RpoN/RPB10)
MLDVITCTSCGCCLGEKVPLYDFLVEKIKREYYQFNFEGKLLNDRVQWDSEWKLKLGSVLDALEIKLLCCRKEMLGKTTVAQLLKE